MRDTLILFRLLAIPAILAGCVLALPMYALREAELDVRADKIIIWQKNDELGKAAEVIKQRKVVLVMPIKWERQRRK